MNSNLRKSWMWAEACALLDEAERKHRRFFELLAVPAAHPVWEPPADIFADGSDIQVVVALPGARAEEVVVQITPTGLQIETMVSPPSLGARVNVVRVEIGSRRVAPSIDLSSEHYALVERQLDRG